MLARNVRRWTGCSCLVFRNVVVIGVVIALQSVSMFGQYGDGIAATRMLFEANVESLGQCLEWWRTDGESEVVC